MIFFIMFNLPLRGSFELRSGKNNRKLLSEPKPLRQIHNNTEIPSSQQKPEGTTNNFYLNVNITLLWLE